MKELKGIVVKGIDINEKAVSQARRINLPVERVKVRGLVQWGEIFDGVCAFQVPEHIRKPRGFLEALIQVLAPRGGLILSVPNSDSFLRHQRNLLGVLPHRMTCKNGKVLAYLPSLFPLTLLPLRFEPLAFYYTPGYVDAYGESWRSCSSFLRCYPSETRMRCFADLLREKGLNRFLPGQSLYGVFQEV